MPAALRVSVGRGNVAVRVHAWPPASHPTGANGADLFGAASAAFRCDELRSRLKLLLQAPPRESPIAAQASASRAASAQCTNVTGTPCARSTAAICRWRASNSAIRRVSACRPDSLSHAAVAA